MPGKFDPAAVQYVQHHLDAGALGLETLDPRDVDIDAVTPVRNHVEPEVLVELLHLDGLPGLVHVSDKETDVAPQLISLALFPRGNEPKVGPPCEAGPVLEALHVIVVLVLGERGAHAEGIRAMGRLSEHEAAHVFRFDEAVEDGALHRVVTVLGERLEEQRAVDPDRQRERERLVRRRSQNRLALVDVAATAAIFFRNENGERHLRLDLPQDVGRKAAPQAKLVDVAAHVEYLLQLVAE